jgi:hypothetical protein
VTKPIVYRSHTTGKWVVADAPEDWRDGENYPAASTKDRFFDTKDEADREANRRLPQPAPNDVD